MEPYIAALTECKEEHSSSDSMDSLHEEARPASPKRAVPLIKRLGEFRFLALGCDVNFLVGPKQRSIAGHKLILACASEVFKAMFYGLLSDFPHAYPPHQPPGLPGQDSLEEEAEEGADDADHSSLSCSLSSDGSFGEPQAGGLLHRHEVERAEEEEPEQEDGAEQEHQAPELQHQDQPATRFPVELSHRPCSLPAVQTVLVPDINPSAFRKMVDFIYSDCDAKSVHLTDHNVMEVLYAAKKYAIDALVDECVRYLLNDLTACNAVFLLSQARLFQEETLLERCLEVIDRNTDVALQGQYIEDVDLSTLMEVIGRTQLDPSSELVVFKAAKAWARAECQRQKLEPSSANLRAALGPALKLIRYPLMNVKEFGVVAMSDLLTTEEIAEVFTHLVVSPPPPCRYPAGFRCSSRSRHLVSRFGGVSSKRCSKREHKVSFTVDRDILLYGIGIYGMQANKPHSEEESSWRCQVEVQLSVAAEGCGYAAPLSVLASNTVFMQGLLGDDSPLLAPFPEAVPCAAHLNYVASMRFISETAVHTLSGRDGRDCVVVELPYDQRATFKFNGYRNSYGDDGFQGQIPTLHFYVHWPEKTDA